MAEGVELATAYVTIIPSLKGATKQIESQLAGVDTSKAGSAIGKSLGGSIGKSLDLKAVGDGLSSAGARLADVGGKLTAGVTVPLAGATAAVGTFALRTASAAETSEMAFTTMLGSADEAREMMGELADFAAHTPFELSGLTTATQQLMAYGFEAEEVIPMLTAVGDATAALGTGQAGIESVTRALGQMQTRGKVSAEEMLQLTEAGIPAWEYLAEAIGTDTAGAMEAVSSGAVDAQTGIDALTAGMERDFGGMMESQSKTVAGLMSNLSDAIQQPLMELRDSRAYEAFASALGKVVDAAGPFVESLLPHMENALSTVSDVLGVAADAMDSFSNMSYSSQKQLLTLVTAAAAAGPAMSVLGRGVQGVGTILTGVGKASETFSKLLGKIPTSANKAAAATTAVTDAATDAAGGVTGAATAASGLGASLSVLGTSVAVAGAAYVIGSVASVAMEAYENAETLKTATMDLGSALTNVQPNAEALSGSIGNMNYSAELAAEQLASLNQETLDAFGEVATQSAQLDSYTSTIQELANKSSLTASEQQRLKAAVEGYNKITGDSVEITNAATGELSKNTEEIIKNANAYKQRAKAQAAEESLTQYYAQQIDLEQQIAAAQEDVNQKQATYNQQLDDLKAKYGNHWRDHVDQIQASKGEYERAEESLNSLNEQYDSVNENIDTMSGIAAASAAQLSGPLYDALQAIPPEMQTVGTDVANALQAGIDSGSINAETAAAMLSSGIVEQVNRLPSSMQAAGATAAANLATAVQNGQITSQQAAQILTAAIDGEVSTLPPELQAYGQQAASDLGVSLENGAPSIFGAAQTLVGTAGNKIGELPGIAKLKGAAGGQGMASGMNSQSSNVRGAANNLSSQASHMGDGDSWTWGSHMAGNFASGLRSGIGKVASAASALASQAAAYLKHSTPKFGPLADDDVWGLHLGENLADGMLRALPDVERASDALAVAASVDAATTFGARSMRAVPPRADGGSSATDDLLRQVVSLLADIYGVIPEGMDGRAFGRAVRRAVAYGY